MKLEAKQRLTAAPLATLQEAINANVPAMAKIYEYMKAKKKAFINDAVQSLRAELCSAIADDIAADAKLKHIEVTVNPDCVLAGYSVSFAKGKVYIKVSMMLQSDADGTSSFGVGAMGPVRGLPSKKVTWKGTKIPAAQIKKLAKEFTSELSL